MMIKIKKTTIAVICTSILLNLLPTLSAAPALAKEPTPYVYTQTVKQGDISLSNEKKEFYSDQIESDFAFNSLILSWEDQKSAGAQLGVEVQIYNKNWSKWYPIEPTIDGETAADFATNSSFFISNPSTALRYHFFVKGNGATADIKNIEFTLFNARQEPNIRVKTKFDDQFLSFADNNFVVTTTTNSSSDLKVITRKEWGADESLNVSSKNAAEAQTESSAELSEITKKYADELKVIRTITRNAQGQTLKWPLEYPEKVRKIIIHHTATSEEALVASAGETDKVDYKQIVRNIQYYHAVKRGWGDIGYNYVIDPEGNIYEGRYGEAVGAHAAGSNLGSIGISVIGNYQEKEVPSAVLNSIVKLSANKAKKFGIQADGKSSFRGETDFNILGHRDVTATACPGQNLYDVLPTVRKLAAAAASNEKSNLDYEFSDVSKTYAVDLNRNESKVITITLKNIGKKTWGTGTYLTLDDSIVNSALLNVKKQEGIKVALMKEKTVAPGKTANFQFTVSSNSKSGLTELDLTPFVKDGTKTNKIDHKLYLPVFVNEPVYTYELVKASLPPAYVQKGTQLTNVWVELKNTGNVSWSKTKDAVVLGTDGPRDRVSLFVKGKPYTRMAFLTQDEVKPGQVGRFNFSIKAPDSPGQYTENFTPVVEGVTWMKDKKMKFETYVYSKKYEALVANTTFSQNLKINQDAKIKLSFKNSGGVVWKKGSFSVDVTSPAAVKVSKKEIQNKEVKPGETIDVTITVKPSNVAKDGLINIMPKIGAEKLLNQPKSLSYKINGKVQPSSTSSSDKGVTTSSGTNVSANNADTIRVKIGFDGDPKIKSDKGMTLYSGKSKIETYQPNREVQVTYKSSKYEIRQGTSSRTLTVPPRFIANTGSILEISNFDRTTAWNKDLNDNKFRGNLEIIWDEDKLVTVNELPIESYLKGLAENGNDEAMEKMKALIVAARTYAVYYTTIGEKFPGKAWHLDDDPAVSQKYLGYGYELRAPRAVEAVEATKREVIRYNGKLIKTPYFSQSAGRTLSAEEVWGWKDTPYLKSVKDTYCGATELKGHGVGLSGCGARGMADAGKTYKEILKYFYSGVEIGI